MIRTLDTDNFWFESTFVRVQVFEELELRGRRPDDENGIDIVECSCNLAEEPSQIVWVFSRFPMPFRVPVDMVLLGQHRCFVRRVRMDVKGSRFLVIDPDDSVG
jgi:hypothetical protein